MKKKFRFNLFFVFLISLAFVRVSQAQFGQSKNIVQLKTYKSFNQIYAGSEFKIALETSISNGWHINSNKPHDNFLIPTKLTIDSIKGFKLDNVYYPQAQDIKLSFSETPLSVWEGEIFIAGLIKTSKDLTPGNYNLIANLEYQSCNNKTCLAPTSIADTISIEIVNNKTAVAEINQDIFSKINLNYSTTQTVTSANDNSITNVLEHSGLILSLLFIFIGGLALNLTPCVYPLIPITIGFFGGQSEGSTKKLFMMGLFFVIGMALTYSVVGVVTALSGAVFGSLMQNPIVIVVIALIFVVLSLSMFGLYEIQMPNALVAKAGGAKGGYYGAFFMGLTMGIVAAPCIGPFVLGLVTYVAAKADPFTGFLMFFVLALGLGLPYLILAVFSGKIKKLPKSGIWMEGVKHVFGFVLLGMAFYFLLPLLPKSFSGYVLPVFLIITAGYLLLFEKIADKVKGFKIFKIAFSIIILGVAIYALIPSEKQSINWKAYSPSIASANVQNNKGTIIDFYADWCIPCKELEASTFSDPKVIAESKDFNAYKANMTKSLSPDVQALRVKYSIVGVPTVLILNSQGKEVKRITGYIDANEFLKMLKEVD